MTATSISSPFDIFTDSNGDPLQAGYIYIGTANLNPETNPITVYWDSALTVPALQPIRTIGGYPSRNGSAAKVYSGVGDYSITVRDSRSNLVFNSLVTTERISADLVTVADGSGGSLWTTVAGFVAKIISSSGSSIIGFIQSGTGATARTAQGKMRDAVSVLDFGAVGDGLTDDSAEIQAALNAHGTVLFPSGTYLVGTPLTMNSNNSIVGIGAVTIKKSATMASPLISATSKTNVSISDIAIDGNQAIQLTGVSTVKFDTCSKVRLNNLLCANLGASVAAASTGAIQFDNCTDAQLMDSYIYTTWGMNAVMVSGGSGKYAKIHNNYIHNTVSDSPITVDTSPYASVKDNYVEIGAGSLVSFNGPHGVVEGNTLIASATMSAQSHGIVFGHPTATYAADYSSASHNKIIMGGFGYAGIGINNGDRVVVDGNFISGTTANTYGIVSASTNSTISNNDITGIPSCIYANSTANFATISSNNVYGTLTGTFYGIDTAAPTTVISNNTINNFTRAVNIQATATKTTFSGNNVAGFSSFGAVVAGVGYSIVGNQFNASGAGQCLLLNAADGTVSGNVLNTSGTAVTAGYGSLSAATFWRGNMINAALAEESVTLLAGDTSKVVSNANIVPGGPISLIPIDADFNSRNVFVSATSLGSLTLTCLAGNEAALKVAIL